MSGPAPNGEPLQAPWAYYRRTGLSEMRPYVLGESLEGISVSEPDKNHIAYCLDSGKNPAGYIARNPKNHADQWYVAQAYFEENLEPVRERDDTAELVEELDRKWRDERTERRRAEVERDRLGAELQQVYAKQQADLEEMVEGHVAEIMDAAAVDGLSVAKSRVDPAAELADLRQRVVAFDENLEVANSPELLPCFNQGLYSEWKELVLDVRAALAKWKERQS